MWSFNIIRLHVMCSIAIFSSTKSLNFSMTYFAKNIIHMNFVECFVILHHWLILSFAFDEFLCIFTCNFKVYNRKFFTLLLIDQFKGVLFMRTKLHLKLLERDSFNNRNVQRYTDILQKLLSNFSLFRIFSSYKFI